MSDRDELATSPPLAPASSPKKKRKRKRPAEEEAEVEPPVAMTPDDSLVLVKPKKKKRKVEAVAEAVDELAPAAEPAKKRKKKRQAVDSLDASASFTLDVPAPDAAATSQKAKGDNGVRVPLPALPATFRASLHQFVEDAQRERTASRSVEPVMAEPSLVEAVSEPRAPKSRGKRAPQVNGHVEPIAPPSTGTVPPSAIAVPPSTTAAATGDLDAIRADLAKRPTKREHKALEKRLATLEAKVERFAPLETALDEVQRQLATLSTPATSARHAELEADLERARTEARARDEEAARWRREATEKAVEAKTKANEAERAERETERLRREADALRQEAARREQEHIAELARLRDELEAARKSSGVPSNMPSMNPRAAPVEKPPHSDSSSSSEDEPLRAPHLSLAAAAAVPLPESESDPSEASTEDEAPAAPKPPRPRLSLFGSTAPAPAPAPARSPSPVDPGFRNGKDLALEALKPPRLSIDAAYLALADEEERAANGDDNDEEGSDATPVASSVSSPKGGRWRGVREESKSPSEASEDEGTPATTRAPRVPETLEDVVEKSVMLGEPDVPTTTGITEAAVDQETVVEDAAAHVDSATMDVDSVEPATDVTAAATEAGLTSASASDAPPAPASVADEPSEADEPGDATQTLVDPPAPTRHSWTPVAEDGDDAVAEGAHVANDAEQLAAEDDDEVSQIDWSQPPTTVPRLPRPISPTPSAPLIARKQDVASEPPVATIDPAVLQQPPSREDSHHSSGDEAAPSTMPPLPEGRTRARVRTFARQAPPADDAAAAPSPSTSTPRTTRSAARMSSQPSVFAASFEQVKQPVDKRRKSTVGPASSSQGKTLRDLEDMGKEKRLARFAKPKAPTATPVKAAGPAAPSTSRLARLAGGSQPSKTAANEAGSSDESESD